MANFIGRLVEVGVAKESTRKLGASDADFWLSKDEFSFDDKIEQVRVIGSVGKLADSQEAIRTVRYGAGALTMDLGSQSIGYFLYSMLGSLSTAGPTDSAYTHTISIDEDNQHQSLALFAKDGNNTEQYKLAMVNTLEFNATLEDTVKVSVDFMSKKGESHSTLTPSYTSEYKFTKNHASVKVASNIAGLSGATAIPVKSLRLTLNGNVQLDNALGTASPEDIFNHQLSVEGEFVLNYSDSTYKDLFTAGTNQALQVVFSNTDQTISSGSTNPSLTFQMPKVDIVTWEPDYTLDEISTQTVSFKASYDVANSLNIISTCSLVNGKTSY